MSTETAVDASAAPARRTPFGTWMTLWAGQFASVVGSELTAFALGVWAFRETGSATAFTLVMFFAQLPIVLLAPFAGALVDRWDRRLTLMAANALGAAAMAGLGLLVAVGWFEVWHIYPAIGLVAVANAFHWPAFSAVPALIVRPDQLGRAAGMVELSVATAKTVAPALATVLVGAVMLAGVVFVDAATFLIALGSLWLVRIPRPPAKPRTGSLWADVREGWRYVVGRPALIRLMVFFLAINVFFCFALVLAVPLVASFTTPRQLGITTSIGAAGLVLGGIVMSVWGGPRRRIYGVVGAGTLLGVTTALAGLRPWVPLVAVALFGLYFWIPVMNGSSQAIWQAKVPTGLQGRVFALRRTIATATAPIGFLTAGLLADHVFGPLMQPGGGLADTAGRVLGTGPGRGIALMFVLVGLACVLVGVWGLSSPQLMRVDTDLPDAVAADRTP
jgi:MFS family permease